MDTEKLIATIKLAKDIIDCCSGDEWERECAEGDREQFLKVYNELFPEDGASKTATFCDVCGRNFGSGEAYKKHVAKSSRHARKVGLIKPASGDLPVNEAERGK